MRALRSAMRRRPKSPPPSGRPSGAHPKNDRAGCDAYQDRRYTENPGEAEGADEDVGEPGRVLRGLDDLDDDGIDRVGLNHRGQESTVNGSSASVLTARPLGPFGR